MSTLALEGSETRGASDAGRRERAPLVLRYADLVLLAIAMPIFVIAGWPLLGYAAATVAWLAQHAILVFAQRRSRAALLEGDRRTALGLIAGSTLGRAWLVAAAILLTGLLADREDGLAAAILAAALVTAHLGSEAIARLLTGGGSR